MATEATLRTLFKEALAEDPAVVTRCIELCNTYNLKEDDLHLKWETYSANNHLSTEEKLSMKHLDKLSRIIAEQKQPVKRNVRAQEYNKNTVHILANDLLSIYGAALPVAAPSSEHMEVDENADATTPPGLARDRKSGQVEALYNASVAEVQSMGAQCDLQVLQHVPRYDYMYDRFEDQLQALARTEQVLGEQFARQGLSWDNETDESADQELRVLGRVVHRGKDGTTPTGALSADSLALVVNTRAYRLDVLSLPELQLVPGQRVVVTAVKAHATRLRVSQLVSDAPLVPAPLTTRATRVLIATGPYTARTDLQYQGLEYLFARAHATAPDVLILLGPFVDVDHPHVLGAAEMARSVEDEFAHVLALITHQAQQLRHTRVVLVPSLRDAHQPFVYPQPAYSGETSERVHMCSNPSVISINGVRFGLSTADIVRHLAAEELAPRTAEDRIGRLLRHVIGQQSFYPLYPAHSEVPLHLSQYARCMFEQAPHVLVFASQLAHFAKSVAGVLCLNAGRVVNGAQSGTCLELHLPAHDQCAVAEQARVNLVYL